MTDIHLGNSSRTRTIGESLRLDNKNTLLLSCSSSGSRKGLGVNRFIKCQERTHT